MNKRMARFGLGLLLVAAIAAAIVFRNRFDTAALEAWVAGAGAWASILFILVYAVGAVIFLPGSVLTLAGGALFGPVLGTFYNLTGATIGAALAFLVARYLASDWVEHKTGGWLRRLINGVEAEGWRFVAFVRLVPLIPFNVLNYALGLTRIRLSHYVLATYTCMLPASIAYTYLGYAGREAVAGGDGLFQKILLALGLLAVVAFLPRMVARLRRKPTLDAGILKERLDKGADILVLDVRGADERYGKLGHIPGSLNIPLNELAQRLAELEQYQERPLAIICRSDRRSEKAARILAQAGFADVHVVNAGMEQWSRAGYPVIR